MTKFGLALAASLLLTHAASAAITATVIDKKSCARAVTDAREALDEASLAKETRAQTDRLIRISAHLCTQANFVFADQLLAIARGMTVSDD